MRTQVAAQEFRIEELETRIDELEERIRMLSENAGSLAKQLKKCARTRRRQECFLATLVGECKSDNVSLKSGDCKKHCRKHKLPKAFCEDKCAATAGFAEAALSPSATETCSPQWQVDTQRELPLEPSPPPPPSEKLAKNVTSERRAKRSAAYRELVVPVRGTLFVGRTLLQEQESLNCDQLKCVIEGGNRATVCFQFRGDDYWNHTATTGTKRLPLIPGVEQESKEGKASVLIDRERPKKVA